MAALRPQGAVLGAQAVLAMTTATLHVPAIGEYSFISVLSLAQLFAGALKEGSPSQTLPLRTVTHPIYALATKRLRLSEMCRIIRPIMV
jgi:hypothetical protein